MIKTILTENGFEVTKEDDGYAIHQYTPEGEDWWLYFDKLTDIVEYAEYFSPDDEFEMWVEAKHNGVRGVPGISELWQDQLWKQGILNKVAKEIEDSQKNKKNKKRY